MRRPPIRKRSLRKLTELALTAPQVVVLRTLGTHDRREWTRMGTEKVDVFSRSIAAMNAQWMRAAFELPFVLTSQSWQAWMTAWTAPLTWSPRNRAIERHWRRAAARAFDHGLVPVHRTAVANLRRLSRR
jgi:hypothetical protein